MKRRLTLTMTYSKPERIRQLYDFVKASMEVPENKEIKMALSIFLFDLELELDALGLWKSTDISHLAIETT